MNVNLPILTEEDQDRYAWQMSVHGVGEEGQQRLKGLPFSFHEWEVWVVSSPMNWPRRE